MTKDEIKKGLECCCNSDFKTACRNCPYLTRPRCNDTLCKDALNLITEQEKEIEQLKEQIEELRNEKWDAQDDLDCYYDEMPSKIKQAKIDVLNKLKRQAEHCDQWNCEVIPKEYIDEMIEEQLKK